MKVWRKAKGRNVVCKRRQNKPEKRRAVMYEN